MPSVQTLSTIMLLVGSSALASPLFEARQLPGAPTRALTPLVGTVTKSLGGVGGGDKGSKLGDLKKQGELKDIGEKHESDGQEWEGKCHSIKDVREELRAVEREDWSRCPGDKSHDQWKELLEHCVHEKGWKHDDREWKGDDHEWKHDDKEWKGEDKEWKHDDKEWKDDKDDEWKGKDDEWKGKDDEWKGSDKEWKHGKDEKPWKGIPEHSCIPSKYLPKNRKMSVEEWLYTIDKSSVISKKEQFETLLD